MRQFVFFIYFFLALGVFSYSGGTQAVTPEEQQRVQEEIDKWYQQTQLANYQISKDLFTYVVKKYFELRRSEHLRNIIGIVDFTKPANQPRFFVFSVGNGAHFIAAQYVSHGDGCQDHDKNGNKSACADSSKTLLPQGFADGNGCGSHYSYLGFMKTGGSVQSNFPYAHKILDLEQRSTHPVDCGIWLHGTVGFEPEKNMFAWSDGCLGVPLANASSFISSITPNVLLYVHGDKRKIPANVKLDITSQEIDEVGSAESINISERDPSYKTIDDTPLASSGTTTSDDFSSPGVGGFAASGPSGAVAAASDSAAKNTEAEKGPYNQDLTNSTAPVVKSAPLQGSPVFADCQKRVDSRYSWKDVVREASKPYGNPSKYFSATYKTLYHKVQSSGVTYSEDELKHITVMNNRANKNCIALARAMKDCDPEVNENVVLESSDGSLRCSTTGYEGQDYCVCKGAVEVINEAKEVKKDQEEYQQRTVKKYGQVKTSEVVNNRDNAQQVALTAQGEFLNAEGNMVGARAEFHEDKAALLEHLLKDMPSRDSIIQDCQQYFNGKTFGQNDVDNLLTAFNVRDHSVDLAHDSCAAMSENMGVNVIQNLDGKRQLEKIVAQSRNKADELYGKESVLKGRSKFSSSILSGGGNGGGTLDNQQVSENDMAMAMLNKNSNRQWKKERGEDSYERSSAFIHRDYHRRSRSYHKKSDPQEFLNFIKGLTGKRTYAQGKDRKYYSKIRQALEGKIAFSELSADQKKEYKRIMQAWNDKQKNNRRKSEDRYLSLEEQKKSNQFVRQIWFNKNISLFKIISHRYQSKMGELTE